ncbi:aldo/keto reductase [Paroceanicella profunda]|uniref:Aldo/keto reductase n=1 Tax=Paroceanicella profunda TaxID=2579971 RepID=A0A5B8FXZ8_9RHOB|nr:aldo/keto reductase [Paroceanicella profunda]QDL92484.1 aldo/keto reductase [Paroceanicella profunda]
MIRRALGTTGFEIAPLVFGGNVLGWTADEARSFEVLDAFVDHGFNAIDTADVYSAWAPGNSGGESETILGRWLKARPGMRERIVLFTKVGSAMGAPERKGLSRRWILQAVEDSLRRLGVESIDLYFSHWPDDTPPEETLGAYDTLLRAGKIRAIGASNFDAGQLAASLAAADAGLPAYQVLQPELNLYNRGGFEGALQELCVARQIGVVTYFSLASGFLSGKYRSKADLSVSARGSSVEKYLDEKGLRVLAALDTVAERQGAQPADVSLAWLMAHPGVTAPIASATTPAQVESFARAADLSLTADDMALLNSAGL